MDPTTILFAWAALAVVAVISPGPDVLLVAGHAARGGRRDGLLAVAGITVGSLWYMALCGFGFLSILTASPTLFAIVKIGGALYLAYLGLMLIKGAISPAAVTETKTVTLSVPFRQGLITNALNPKVALFYLAALPQFTGNGPDAPLIGVALIAVHYVIGGVWLSLLAIGASKASGMAKNTVLWRWIDGMLGAAFIGLAGKIALERN
jgi:threonine/homoserine/homoserine lactone efflux protein